MLSGLGHHETEMATRAERYEKKVKESRGPDSVDIEIQAVKVKVTKKGPNKDVIGPGASMTVHEVVEGDEAVPSQALISSQDFFATPPEYRVAGDIPVTVPVDQVPATPDRPSSRKAKRHTRVPVTSMQAKASGKATSSPSASQQGTQDKGPQVISGLDSLPSGMRPLVEEMIRELPGPQDNQAGPSRYPRVDNEHAGGVTTTTATTTTTTTTTATAEHFKVPEAVAITAPPTTPQPRRLMTRSPQRSHELQPTQVRGGQVSVLVVSVVTLWIVGRRTCHVRAF